jgi:hypothetical protein
MTTLTPPGAFGKPANHFPGGEARLGFFKAPTGVAGIRVVIRYCVFWRTA